MTPNELEEILSSLNLRTNPERILQIKERLLKKLDRTQEENKRRELEKRALKT